MTFSEYVGYWKAAAISNKGIAHVDNVNETFKRMNIARIWNDQKLDMNKRCLILENPEIKPFDALSDNVRKKISGAIWIIDTVERGDFPSEETVMNECEAIAIQMKQKIWNDAKKAKMISAHPYKISVDLNTVNMNAIGPIFGNWFGWRLTFQFETKYTNNLHLKNDEWINDTAI